MEPLPGVGSAASMLTFGTSFIVGGRTAGAFFSVGTTNLTRAEVTAIATRLGQVPETTIAAARAALAEVKAQPGAPPAPLEDIVVRREGLRLLCEQLLPRGEGRCGSRRRLPPDLRRRPASRLLDCEWKRSARITPLD